MPFPHNTLFKFILYLTPIRSSTTAIVPPKLEGISLVIPEEIVLDFYLIFKFKILNIKEKK